MECLDCFKLHTILHSFAAPGNYATCLFCTKCAVQIQIKKKNIALKLLEHIQFGLDALILSAQHMET